MRSFISFGIVNPPAAFRLCNPAIAKFSLAQRGIQWSDRQVIETHNVNIPSTASREEMAAFKANLREFFPDVDTGDLDANPDNKEQLSIERIYNR